MKITINTEVLQRYKITFGEFLVMLMGYQGIKYKECKDKLIRDGTIERNVFDEDSMVLSNNTRDLVAKIILESDEKVLNSNIDFDSLAEKLQDVYPKGNKPGTTYRWGSSVEDIAQKLRTLIAKYDFSFTEEEAIKATKEYVDSFEDKQKMRLLKYFILKTSNDGTIDSMLMTIIENNR